MEILTQIIGIAAMIGSVYSFQLNKHKQIMIAQIIATALFGVQYYLLGALTGVALDAVGVVRDIVFYHKDKSGHRAIYGQSYLRSRWSLWACLPIRDGYRSL